MPEQALHILIVDDHPIYREGLGFILQSLDGYEVSLYFADCLQQAEARLTQSPALDLIILDLKLPDGSGLSLLPFIQRRQLFVPVLVLSASDEQQAARHAWQQGASGFVNKGESPERLKNSVRNLLQGQQIFPDNVGTQPSGSTPPSLTPRQLEVLLLLAQGLPNKRICQQLTITEHTIKSHLKALFSLFDAHTRTECVNKALQLGMLS